MAELHVAQISARNGDSFHGDFCLEMPDVSPWTRTTLVMIRDMEISRSE